MNSHQIGLRVGALVKASEGEAMPYNGYRGVSAQRYMPIARRRELTPSEQNEVADKSRKLLRGPFASDADPVSERLASPLKRALVAALVGGTAGGAFGAVAGSPKLAITGGLGLGGIAGLISYFRNKQENETYVERMRRLPEGATLRDMKSDPVYQQEQDRATQLRAALLIANSRLR